MKILIVCQYYSPEPFKVADLCAELQRQGNLVTVITGIPNYPEGKPYPGYGLFKKRHEKIDNVEIIRVPIVYRGNTKIMLLLNYISFALFGTWQVLNLRKRYDKVLVYQLSPVSMALPGIIYGKVHSVPIYLYVLDLWPDSYIETEKSENELLKTILYRFSRWIYMSSSLIGISSRGFFESLVKMGLSAKDILYIPQYHEDPYTNDEKNWLIRKSRHKNDQLNIIFTGNIGFAQSLGTILDAAEITKKAQYNIHWIIIGEGRAKVALIEACKKKKLEDVVHIRERVKSSDIPSILRSVDVALLVLGDSPLFAKTVPAKLQTYMACGMPILASVNGESAKIIEEANCGLISPAEDAKALAAHAMELFYTPNTKMLCYARNARDYYYKKFTKQNHIKYINQMINKV